jgi:glycosyltransferase involved in cell wall biosynthesis
MPRTGVGTIALDPGVPSGLNRYSMEVLRALLADGEDGIVAYVSSSPLHRDLGAAARLVNSPRLAQSNFSGNLLRLLWHQMRLPAAVKQDGLDVFYSPVPEGMLAPKCPQVVTVHDLLPLHFPEVYPRLRHYCRYVLPRILDASAAIIVDSESTARDLRAAGLVNGLPMHVVYPGFDAPAFRPAGDDEVSEVRQAFGLGDYVLAVGEARPYKNIRRLIEAFARVEVPSLQLVIVGKIGSRDRGILQAAAEFGVEDRVRFLGFVPDEQLAALYTGALAFVFPSLYEGFGIPPLEAMACGCAVVASNAASIPEVCGEAALYVDPLDVDSIAAGIQRVVLDSNLRGSLIRAGAEQVRCFSYAQVASAIRSIVREVAR